MSEVQPDCEMSQCTSWETLLAEIVALRDEVVRLRRAGRDPAVTEARVRRLLHDAREAIVQFEVDGTVSEFNRAAERLFGYPSAAVLGKHGERMFDLSGSFAGNFPGWLEAHSSDEGGIHAEPLVVVCRDGTKRVLEVSAMMTASKSPRDDIAFTDSGGSRRQAWLCVLHDMAWDGELADRGLSLLRSATFSIKTIHEARDLAAVLAKACPDPNRAVIGLAELLLNAVEHGNLAIDYEEKAHLRDAGFWDEEVERRLADPVYAEREVEVQFSRETDVIRIRISDEGEGFAWQDYLEMDPARLLHSHGRGIAMSRLMSFDTIEYRGCGNEVEVTIALPAD